MRTPTRERAWRASALNKTGARHFQLAGRSMTEAQECADVSELPLSDHDVDTNQSRLRLFRLSLDGVVVELCNLGASITKLCLPRSDGGEDDCVLGYESADSMLTSSNPPYLGVIVGRVANRIGNAKFQLEQEGMGLVKYQLTANNGKNTLHGGPNGFSSHIWDAEIVKDEEENFGKSVKFTLVSDDGDEGFPASIRVTATYSLVHSTETKRDSANAVILRLQMGAKLLENDKNSLSTPINLAQHSYFNLASHNSPQGILDHRLTLPSLAYTPTDATSIPTKEIRPVKEDPTMDFSNGRVLREALIDFGVNKANLTLEEATKNVSPSLSRCLPDDIALAPSNGEPYGFDHNYVVHREVDNSLSLAAVVEHPPTGRRMIVWTDAPGVQVYTSNYLNGTSPNQHEGKGDTAYGQWQGLCLETQNFPDSIMLPNEEKDYADFARGKCFILHPEGLDYAHNVEYVFDQMET